MKFTQLAIAFQEKVQRMNKRTLVQMAYRVNETGNNIPMMAITLSAKNVNSMRHLLYRAYVLGMVKALAFRGLNYDMERLIGTFFDFQPLYYNKFLELELYPTMDLELRAYSRMSNVQMLHGHVVKFSLWIIADEDRSDELPDVPKELVMTLFTELDKTVCAAEEEMAEYKRYVHCLAFEKEGKTSTYKMKWKDMWAQKQVAQEEPAYYSLSGPNWWSDTCVVRPQAQKEYEHAHRMKLAREIQKRLLRSSNENHEDSDGPEDVDYRSDDDYRYD